MDKKYGNHDSGSFDSDNDSAPEEYFDSDGGDDAVDEAQELREQLRDVPLGEIKKLKDKVGLKRYNQVLFGLSKDNEDGGNSAEGDQQSDLIGQKTGLSNKNVVDKKSKNKEMSESKKKAKSEPMEMSSKKKTFNRPRHVVKNDKRSVRDPRFSDLSGHLNEDLFKKSYSFVDEMKKSEYSLVKKQLKKVKNKEQKEDLLRLKQKMDSEQKLEVEKAKKRELDKQRKANVEAEGKVGKKPFYLKKSDQKKIELANKYRDLKSSGKLEKFMMKKRKKNAQKDRKNLPREKMS